MPVDILIGMDHYWALVNNGLKHLPECSVLLETLYGWVLSGKNAHTDDHSESISLLSMVSTVQPLLRNICDLGSIGILLVGKEAPDLVLDEYKTRRNMLPALYTDNARTFKDAEAQMLKLKY